MRETFFFFSFLYFVFLLCGSLLLSVGEGFSNITYDHRALVIDGKRRVLISGSIHYPRSTPEMWPDLVQKSKEGGLDVIDTYVFWDLHEPVQNQYDFQGRKDLVKFVKTVGNAGLYVHLRIGPFVCAEWNYGGLPVWLHLIPGTVFRTDNKSFKNKMRQFTTKIVHMMKQQNLFASQGGPIILAQIENEYGRIESAYGPAGKSYVKWAARMSTLLGIGVPWVMCGQPDAPDPIINTCNSFYCDRFIPNSSNKPKMWTESYTGWFFHFGGSVPHRPVEDIAYAVAHFYQRGGTFQNYYMYHGGTNFGRSAGGPFITTTYDYDAPIDEYGNLRQPKWGHLKDLHKSIKLCEEAMIATDPTYISLGSGLEAHVYNTSSEACAAFLANTNIQSDATVIFNGNTYYLPAWSVSILPDCKNVVFNTAQINSQATRMKMRRPEPETSHQTSKEIAGSCGMIQTAWSWVSEPVGISKSNAFNASGLLEQINTTADVTDYLWYSIRTEIHGDEPFLNGNQTILHVETLGHVLHAFINGKLAGSGIRNSSEKFTLEKPITLVSGQNTIDLLSLTVGLQNSGAFYDKTTKAGISGPVKLIGKRGSLDLSSNEWTYQIGLKGEELDLYKNSSGSTSPWISENLPKNQPLIWYKRNFDAPDGDDPIVLDSTGMGKGEAWVNGQSIGRYWPTYISPKGGCEDSCDYRGPYHVDKCFTGCGLPSQKLYHVPRSWIQPSNNTLVLFEEMGGDPTQISLAQRQVESLCAHVSELHPPPLDAWESYRKMGQKSGPLLHLECPSNKLISKIKFSSFGTPQGSCGSYGHGMCSSDRALAVVRQACVGLKNCSIRVSTETFGDPCEGVIKSLAVEVACT
ncbi:hypothetical protein MRB53_018463 [Persea americana]|uniref:Uncharacterized protein n=1 Tax=Persea americana TaxID=3435 RepID=A0ACC2M7V6_PERAE|nr:hypothetical protein MRB53_018463 [Persea americana]